jgi:hypothetical protein
MFLQYGANLVPVEEGQRQEFKFPTQKGIKVVASTLPAPCASLLSRC